MSEWSSGSVEGSRHFQVSFSLPVGWSLELIIPGGSSGFWLNAKNNQFSFRKMMHLTFSHYSPSLAFQQSSGITFSQLHSSRVSMLVRGGFHLLEERAWPWSWAVSQGRECVGWMFCIPKQSTTCRQLMYLAGMGKATVLTRTPSPACAATVWPWETRISPER